METPPPPGRRTKEGRNVMKAETLNTLERYVEHRIPTGGFLRAFLANDLMEACGRADEENARDFIEIARYVYNEMPASCHGSYEVVDAWLRQERADET